MKKALSPGVIVGILACVVVVAGYFLWHATVDLPDYPGASAGHPGQNASDKPLSGKMSLEQAQQRGISGANMNIKSNGH